MILSSQQRPHNISLVLNSLLCPSDSCSNPSVNPSIYLLFFPGEGCSWGTLILARCFLWPGSSSTGTGVEVTAMADCMPFYGIPDLKEILIAVKDRKAQTLRQCRPLKVTNYLEVRSSFHTKVPLHWSTQTWSQNKVRELLQLSENISSLILS